MSRAGRRLPRGEEGIALVAVLLLLMLVTALCTALTVGASTETLIAQNHHHAAEARAAAEGGLNHAIQITITRLQTWRADGFVNQSAAMTGLLRGPDKQSGGTATDADNGSLESFGLPRSPTRVTLGTGSYMARVLDEDDPVRGVTLTPADRTRIAEDGLPYNDTNTMILVHASGYGRGRTVAILEAAISRLILPAIVTNQNLLINGSPAVAGTWGSVHSNLNLELTGSPDIALDATASGNYLPTGNPTVRGTSGGAFATTAIPPIHAIDYKPQSDFILQADGRIVDNATGSKTKGNTLCNAKANPKSCKDGGYAWTFSGDTWSLGDTTAPKPGFYYAETNIDIGGSPGSSALPVQISIAATGNIDINGSPYLVPMDPDVLFVTDMDLRIGGNFTVPAPFEGQMLVREQVSISGSPSISGQLLVEGAASISPLVTANSISGNPTLTYNGIAGGAGFRVSAWRQIR